MWVCPYVFVHVCVFLCSCVPTGIVVYKLYTFIIYILWCALDGDTTAAEIKYCQPAKII